MNRRFALASLAALFLACGGKVTFDGLPDGGGAGGCTSVDANCVTSSTPSATTSVVNGTSTTISTSTGNECGAPNDGPLSVCGGSGVTSGAGGAATNCVTQLCAQNGDVFQEICSSNACSCELNGVVLCTCALNGGGDFCGGTPSCCPFGQ